MTRILITSLYYAPDETGIGPYTTRVAEHLAQRGYEVTAVTGMPHYPAWRIAERYRGRWSVREVRGGVDVRRRRQHVPARRGIAGRALYEASAFAGALTALALPRPAAVIGIVPSLGGSMATRVAASRFRAPYGIVFQDLVGQASEQSGVGGGALVAGAVRGVEAWTARAAAAVGIVSEGFRPYVESLGVAPARIRRLRNWATHADAREDRAAVRARLGWPDDAIVCLHAGNMGAKQGLENVIACARLAEELEPALRFVLMGDGAERAALERRAAGMPNVSFLGVQPSGAVADVLAAADVLLVNQRGSVRDMALPSKLGAYFAAGRAVVAAAAAGSETAREIEACSSGVVCAPDDPGALLGALQRVARDAGLRAYLASRGREFARNELSEEAALRGYERFVASVLAASGHGRVHTEAMTAPDEITRRAA